MGNAGPPNPYVVAIASHKAVRVNCKIRIVNSLIVFGRIIVLVTSAAQHGRCWATIPILYVAIFTIQTAVRVNAKIRLIKMLMVFVGRFIFKQLPESISTSDVSKCGCLLAELFSNSCQSQYQNPMCQKFDCFLGRIIFKQLSESI